MKSQEQSEELLVRTFVTLPDTEGMLRAMAAEPGSRANGWMHLQVPGAPAILLLQTSTWQVVAVPALDLAICNFYSGQGCSFALMLRGRTSTHFMTWMSMCWTLRFVEVMFLVCDLAVFLSKSYKHRRPMVMMERVKQILEST